MEISSKNASLPVAILIFIAAGGYYYNAINTLSTDGAERIKARVQSGYIHDLSTDLMDDIEGGADDPDFESVSDMSIEFPSIWAKGIFSGKPVVRAEILVNGNPPPDGQNVRYFVMDYGVFFGWRIIREANSVEYTMKWF